MTKVVTSGNGSAKNGLSEADKVALACGISIPMASLLVAIYFGIEHRKARLAKASHQNLGDII